MQEETGERMILTKMEEVMEGEKVSHLCPFNAFIFGTMYLEFFFCLQVFFFK